MKDHLDTNEGWKGSEPQANWYESPSWHYKGWKGREQQASWFFVPKNSSVVKENLNFNSKQINKSHTMIDCLSPNEQFEVAIYW